VVERLSSIMKVLGPNHTDVRRDSGRLESDTSSVTAKRCRRSGIEHSRRTKLIGYLRLIFDVLKVVFFVFALYYLLKGNSTPWSVLPLTWD